MLKRPIIDPVLRPSATPIAPCDLPATFSSSSRLSSSGVHGLFLFFGMAPLTVEMGFRLQHRERRTVPLPEIGRRRISFSKSDKPIFD
jgi:hypothetical protein